MTIGETPRNLFGQDCAQSAKALNGDTGDTGEGAHAPLPAPGSMGELIVNGIFDELDKAMDGICTKRSLCRREKEDTVRAESRERAEKLAALKRQIRDGVYRPDIKDVARLLTGTLTRS